jgi:eukaryotic-like serine/threonine-protein kinase
VTDVDAGPLLGGRYVVGPVLGVGGMAHVHRGTDTLLGRDVALKLFRDDVAAEDALRIDAEVRTLAALNHPGLVAVYDAGTGSAPYLVMELIEGRTLAACCLDGSLGPERVAEVGAELAEALAHVHGRGVVHRDVKPANVLLTQEGRAKLTDFGIARLVDSVRHTRTGLTIGTAPYLSPEQVRGEPVGPASDVYALGLVLLECLTGRREYPGAEIESALARLSRPPAVPDDLPDLWPDLLRRMTATEPTERPDAAEVAAVLRGAPATPTAVLPVRAVRHPLREVASESLRNRWVVAAVAVLVALCVAVVVAVVLAGGDPQPGGGPPPPSTPAARLDRDLADLHDAVSR